MAEIALASVVVQFVQAGAQLVFKIDSLRSKLDLASVKIQHVRASIDELYTISESLRQLIHDSTASRLRDVLSPESCHVALALLAQCDRSVKTIDDILTPLQKSRGNKFHMKLQEFQTLRKEDHIDVHLRRLKELRQTLTTWHTQQILLLVSREA
jgi:hypothetical protein